MDGSKLRDRSKLTGYLWSGFGKNIPEKVSAPLFLLGEKSSPLLSFEKALSPPSFFFEKTLYFFQKQPYAKS